MHNKNQNYFKITQNVNELNQSVYFVRFHLNEYEENPITNQFLHFIDNIKYCQYTGFLLKYIDTINNEDVYEILSNYEINRMKNIIFYHITNREEIYGISNRMDSINLISDNWNELLPYTENYAPWDVITEVKEQNQNLIHQRRTTEKYYLYIIKDTLTNMYKIGITGKLKKRYKTLLSDRFSLIVNQAYEVIDKNHCVILEKRLHKHFENYRNVGEWFDLQHLTDNEIKDEIYSQCDELNYDIEEVDISWSYDDRYSIINKTNNG